MVEVMHGGGGAPVWVTILSVLQVLLLLWFCAVILLGSWKLFRWLVKWKP
jgi:hypothetical protein